MLGGELLWEERLPYRTRMCVDRVGAFDDLSEVSSVCHSLVGPAQPESHMRLCKASPTRQAHVYKLR
jgi:hypothetical protein